MSNPQELSGLQRQVANMRPPQRGPARAPRTIDITPEEWSYDWPKRPTTVVRFGLRAPSSQDMDRAELVARELAEKDGEDAGQKSLESFAVARGLCDPNDLLRPHPSLQMAEDEVPLAFTRRTIERVLAEIADLMVATSPLRPEATDEEIHALAQMLAVDDPFLDMDPGVVGMIRRYLHFAFTRLNG